MRYRRANVAGATYFFTANLADRRAGLLVEHIDALREVLRRVKRAHPFQIGAMVVLPDHLHALWTLPRDDADFATRWMLIKAGFSRQIPPCERRTPSRVAKGERGIWQRRYWESGKGRLLTGPPHTTRQAGPHRAVHEQGANVVIRRSRAPSSKARGY